MLDLLNTKDFGLEVLRRLEAEFSDLSMDYQSVQEGQRPDLNQVLGYAGAAVASAVIDCMGLNLPVSYDDLDVWLFGELRDENRILDTGLNSVCGSNGARNLDMTSYGILFTEKKGRENLIWVDAQNLEVLLDGFDLNHCMVAVSCDGQLVFRPEFVEYLETGKLSVTNPNTVTNTFIRVLNKTVNQGMAIDSSELVRLGALVGFQSEIIGSADRAYLYSGTTFHQEKKQFIESLISREGLASLNLKIEKVQTKQLKFLPVTLDAKGNKVESGEKVKVFHDCEQVEVTYEAFRFVAIEPTLFGCDVDVEALKAKWFLGLNPYDQDKQQLRIRMLLVRIAAMQPENLVYLRKNFEVLNKVDNKWTLLGYLSETVCEMGADLLQEYLNYTDKTGHNYVSTIAKTESSIKRVLHNHRVGMLPAYEKVRYLMNTVVLDGRAEEVLKSFLRKWHLIPEDKFERNLRDVVDTINAMIKGVSLTNLVQELAIPKEDMDTGLFTIREITTQYEYYQLLSDVRPHCEALKESKGEVAHFALKTAYREIGFFVKAYIVGSGEDTQVVYRAEVSSMEELDSKLASVAKLAIELFTLKLNAALKKRPDLILRMEDKLYRLHDSLELKTRFFEESDIPF
ncbi:hypothetical protein [Vibrio barjaei]|uniref:hypothetical protein n=1 Tax=Vibrio barjaei TaxID=1676683 RepID=UPI002284F6B5|nr:hypothetical protein [Vibrio barjaei]MCY9873018.1 hypothetical protein [Vibrio barjaei]